MMSTGHVRPGEEAPGIDGCASPERVPLRDEDVPASAVRLPTAYRFGGVFLPDGQTWRGDNGVGAYSFDDRRCVPPRAGCGGKVL